MSSQRMLVHVLCERKWPICEYQVFGDRKTKCRELLGIRRCEQNVLPGFRAKCRESPETLVGGKNVRKNPKTICGNYWSGKDARKRPNAKCRELPGRRKMFQNIRTRNAKNCRGGKKCVHEMPGMAGKCQGVRRHKEKCAQKRLL